MLDYRTDGQIAWATLNRPEKLNAMTRSFWPQLRNVVLQAEDDRSVRVLVFSGAGSCFSVGGDIAGFGELGDAADRRRYLREAIGALRAVADSSVPTIAAVHGHAVGGGCELTMVCDIVIADDTARFGTPETSVGLIPGLAGARGAAHLNLHWMNWLVLTGEFLTADEARVAGLVNRVTPAGEHLEAAHAVATAIAAKAPLAISVGKQLLAAAYPKQYEHAIDAVAFLQTSADFNEGIEAFAQRRQPQFEGR